MDQTEFMPLSADDIPFDGNEEEFTELILGDDVVEGDYMDFLQIDDDAMVQEQPDLKVSKRPKGRKQLTVATCEVCGIVMKHPSKIKEHMTTHTGEKPHRCEICGVCFSQKTPLNNHVRACHLNDLPYTCSFGCGKRFVNNARRNAHELRHVGRKRQGEARPHLKPPKRLIMYKPGEEPQAQDVNLPSTSHSHFEHVPEGTSRVTEPANRIDDVIASVLAKNVVQILPAAQEEPLPETVKATKQRKKNQSKGPTIGQCTICGLILKHPSKIQEHAKTHEGVSPYICGECGCTFTKPTSLRVHIQRKHIGVRPFPCGQCGKAFFTPGTRNEHEKLVHLGIKRYQCTVEGCGKVFARRYAFMAHREHRHPEYYRDAFDVEEIVEAESSRIPEVSSTEMIPMEMDQHMLINTDTIYAAAMYTG